MALAMGLMELTFGIPSSEHLGLCLTFGVGGLGVCMSVNLTLWTCLYMPPTLRSPTRFLKLCLLKSVPSSAIWPLPIRLTELLNMKRIGS